MKKAYLNLSEEKLHKIVNESISKVIKESYYDDDFEEDDEEMTFEDKEVYWLNHSVSYENSAAVRMAINFVRKTNPEYYKKIIEVGYEESFD